MYKNTFLNRVKALVLAGAIGASLTIPAFAAGDPTGIDILDESASSFSITMNGEVYTPTIRVAVSATTGVLYVNPGRGAVKGAIEDPDSTEEAPKGIIEGTDPMSYELKGYGVASTPIIIRSDTEDALNVSATVTASLGKKSEAAISKTAVLTAATDADGVVTYTDKVKTRSVYMYVTGQYLGDAETIADEDGNYSFTATYAETATTKSLPSPTADSSALDNKPVAGENYAVITAADTAVTATKVCTIAGAEFGTTDGTTEDTSKVIPEYGAVVIVGQSTKSPTIAWTANDTVTAKVVLSFSAAS